MLVDCQSFHSRVAVMHSRVAVMIPIRMDLCNQLAKLSVKANVEGTNNEPASHFKEKLQIVSSYCEISIAKDSRAFRYEVDILALSTRGQERNLTRGPADDGAASLRRKLCHEIMTSALKKSNGFGTERGTQLPIVYDCRSTLYLPFELKMDGEYVVTLDKDEDFTTLSVDTAYTLNVTDIIRVRISPTTRSAFELDLYAEMMKTEVLDPEKESTRDHSFRTILELLTSSYALANSTHTVLGAGNFFDNDDKLTIDIGDGKLLRPGLSKGVRIVEKEGRRYPALVLDAKNSAFFKNQNLAMSAMELKKRHKNSEEMWKAVRFLFKDVRVVTDPYGKCGKVKSFTIRAITKLPSTEVFVKYKDFEGSLADYYAHFNVELNYPHFMCVEADVAGNRKEYYPLELLYVAPNQRVPIEKTEAHQSSIVLKANAIKPAKRYHCITEQIKRMGLFTGTPVMAAFGVHVIPEFIKLTAGIRFAPEISMGTRNIRIDQKKANWTREANGATYTQESFSLDTWAILYSHSDERNVIEQFASRFCAAAKSRGFSVRAPTIVRFNQNFEATMAEVINRKMRFVMFIDPRHVKSHDSLKLFERLFSVVTQHVTIERVLDVVRKNSRMTLDNIMSKTHMKLGGLNYAPIIEKIGSRFTLDDGNVLVIGYDVAHPTAMTPHDRRMVRALNLDIESLEPSVVGITANCSYNPHEFIGDYHYQAARKESIDVSILEARIVWIMEMLKANRPNHSRPKHIVIMRDGVSEGQYSMAVRDELGALRKALEVYDPDYKPTYTLVVATKRHNKRFFGIDGRGYINTEPGTVIDNTVVRKDVPEFFLQSHFPLQGTAKIPQYNKLYDEANFSMDELQAFVNCLCHTHQIVYLAVSIPEPIYQADELAKRGKNNFNEYRRRFPDNIPRMDNTGIIDYCALTEKLSYWNSPLQVIRFTA